MARYRPPGSSVPQGRHVSVESLPPAYGGWNARDALANMEASDAVTLTNLWPNVSSVDLRGGFIQYATGLSGEVQSLQVYNGAATSEMWAYTAAGDLFNASAAGAVPAAAKSGLSNGYWEYSNITTAGGNYMVSVNGRTIYIRTSRSQQLKNF